LSEGLGGEQQSVQPLKPKYIIDVLGLPNELG
jgi:hypothetical protein